MIVSSVGFKFAMVYKIWQVIINGLNNLLLMIYYIKVFLPELKVVDHSLIYGGNQLLMYHVMQNLTGNG
jgi:hypothetical protein